MKLRAFLIRVSNRSLSVSFYFVGDNFSIKEKREKNKRRSKTSLASPFPFQYIISKRLFENNLHWSTYPNLWLFEVENVSYCRSYIILHHAYIIKTKSFFNILTGNDESSFHFLHCFAAVTLLDASMVGSQYENSVIKDACIFYGLDNLADISIQLLEFLIISGSVMPSVCPVWSGLS